MTKLLLEFDLGECNFKDVADHIAAILEADNDGQITKMSVSGMEEEDYSNMRAWLRGYHSIPDECMPEFIE